MAKERYSDAQDSVIKRLSKKAWSFMEISYQLSQLDGSARGASGVAQRKGRLVADGLIPKTNDRGHKRFITKEALDWYNKQFSEDNEPNHMLELVESKKPVKSNGSSSKSIVSFTKRRPDSKDPQPSYTAILLGAQKGKPEVIQVLRNILEAAVDKNLTAIDILDDLRAAG